MKISMLIGGMLMDYSGLSFEIDCSDSGRPRDVFSASPNCLCHLQIPFPLRTLSYFEALTVTVDKMNFT